MSHQWLEKPWETSCYGSVYRITPALSCDPSQSKSENRVRRSIKTEAIKTIKIDIQTGDMAIDEVDPTITPQWKIWLKSDIDQPDHVIPLGMMVGEL